MMKALASLACAFFLALPAFAADYVWLEGEAPSAHNIDAPAKGWGNKQFLSQQAWLNIDIPADQVEAKVPKDGAVFSYDFNAPSAGKYDAWNRFGF